MAANRKTLDTDLIFLKDIYAKTALNQNIPADYVLITNGDDSTRWDSVSISSFNILIGDDGIPLHASDKVSSMHISTSGPGLTSYTNLSTKSLVLKVTPPALTFTTQNGPSTTIENYSSLNIIGVKDVLLSTTTSGVPPAIFISISSFTSEGYSSIKTEANAWPPYIHEFVSTAQNIPSFVSSVSTTWSTGMQHLSTAERYLHYSTGDVYFSTVSINMNDYVGYIQPGISQMILEVRPTYLLPAFVAGSQPLIKNISSYIQYSGAHTSSFIVSGSEVTGAVTSQQTNTLTSNFFNMPLSLPIDTNIVGSNWLADGASGYYTLYHRIVGGMAELRPGDGCDPVIGSRGGIVNEFPNYINATPLQNGVFIGIYNQTPFPLSPDDIKKKFRLSPAAGGFTTGQITQTSASVNWQGAVGAVGYLFNVNGRIIQATVTQ
jgi:hypothetical protein